MKTNHSGFGTAGNGAQRAHNQPVASSVTGKDISPRDKSEDHAPLDNSFNGNQIDKKYYNDYINQLEAEQKLKKYEDRVQRGM